MSLAAMWDRDVMSYVGMSPDDLHHMCKLDVVPLAGGDVQFMLR